jgi:hypothetical protein
MFAPLMIGAHFSISDFMKVLRSSGVPPASWTPRFSNMDLAAAVRRNSFVAALSLETMSEGVPVGASRAYQTLASKPGRPE